VRGFVPGNCLQHYTITPLQHKNYNITPSHHYNIKITALNLHSKWQRPNYEEQMEQ